MMTSRDFENLATVINDHVGEMGRIGLDTAETYVVTAFLQGIARDLADICEENPQFDRERFMTGCGL